MNGIPSLDTCFANSNQIFPKIVFWMLLIHIKPKTWPVRPLPPCGLLAQKQNQYCSGCSRGDEMTPSWIKIWFHRNVPSNIFLKSNFPNIKLIILSSRRFHFHDGLWPESPSGANCDDDDWKMIPNYKWGDLGEGATGSVPPGDLEAVCATW